MDDLLQFKSPLSSAVQIPWSDPTIRSLPAHDVPHPPISTEGARIKTLVQISNSVLRNQADISKVTLLQTRLFGLSQLPYFKGAL